MHYIAVNISSAELCLNLGQNQCLVLQIFKIQILVEKDLTLNLRDLNACIFKQDGKKAKI